MEILHDAHTWVAISFVLFFGIVLKFGKGALISMLDKRIGEIKEEIKSAEALRIEAQELLAQYQRKHRDAMQESKKIIDNAQKQAEKIRELAESELAETMERREKQLQERLQRLEQSAINEIQKYAADLAIQATAEIIANKLDKQANDRLIDQAIKDIGKTVHQ